MYPADLFQPRYSDFAQYPLLLSRNGIFSIREILIHDRIDFAVLRELVSCPQSAVKSSTGTKGEKI
jgi:hypothetical protein